MQVTKKQVSRKYVNRIYSLRSLQRYRNQIINEAFSRSSRISSLAGKQFFSNQLKRIPVRKQLLQVINLKINNKESMIQYQHQIKNNLLYEKKHNQINIFFKVLRKENALITNNSCLSCCQFFKMGQKIKTNIENELQKIVLIKEQQVFNIDVLAQYLCSLLNCTVKTFLVIGCSQDRTKIQGINLKCNKQDKMIKIIKQIEEKIYPRACFCIDLVAVVNQYPFIKESSKSIQRFCLRISAHAQLQKLYGIQNFPNSDLEFFKFQQRAHTICPVKIKIHNIYSQLNCKFKNNLDKKNKYHNCKRPEPFINFQLFSQKQIQFNKTKQQDQYEDEIKRPCINKYKHNSLIVVGSQKKNKYVEIYKQELIKEKRKFQIMRPFQKIIQSQYRIVWFISHENQYRNMLNLLRKYDKKKNLKILPFSKKLLIPLKKFEEYKNYYKKIFHQVYPKMKFQNIKISEQQQYEMLEFEDYEESIFTYTYFESINIRSIFFQ